MLALNIGVEAAAQAAAATGTETILTHRHGFDVDVVDTVTGTRGETIAASKAQASSRYRR